MNQYIVFKIGQDEYGVDISYIKIIERLMNITRVPKTPDYVKGVINLRGEVVPVISFRKLFGYSEMEYNEETRIIVLANDEITAGIIVDSIDEVISIDNCNIETIDDLFGKYNKEYINGIGKIGERLIILLDVKKILLNE